MQTQAYNGIAAFRFVCGLGTITHKVIDMNISRFTGIIFDMDGLMLDTEPIYWASMQQAASEIGYSFNYEIRAAFIGRSIPAWQDIKLGVTAI